MPNAQSTKSNPKFGPSRDSILGEEKERGRHKYSLWLHYSWKNRQDVRIRGNTAFLHFLWLESDCTVQRYVLEPQESLVVIDGNDHKTKFDAEVYRTTGEHELHEVKSYDPETKPKTIRDQHQLEAQTMAAARENADYIRVGPSTLVPHTQRINNWLQASGYLAACQRHDFSPTRCICSTGFTMGSLIRCRSS